MSIRGKRNDTIDVLKGIGISLIVLGHTGFFGIHFVYLFHVAIFIIASGLFFKSNEIVSLKNVVQFVIKKIKTLYIPYVIVNTLFLLLNNILLKINIYSIETHQIYSLKDFLVGFIKILLFRGTTELAGATWFLHLLFLINVISVIITYILNKIIKNEQKSYIMHLIVSILFLIIGYILTKFDHPDFFSIYIITLNCYWLFILGKLLKIKPIKASKKIINIIIIIVLFGILICLNQIGLIEISKNIYTSPLYFALCSVIGWYFIYYISIIIKDFKFEKIISYIGKNSMYILLFHFLGFKIVNLLLFIILKADKTVLAKFPVAYVGEYCLLYFSTGIIVPILISLIINKIGGKK